MRVPLIVLSVILPLPLHAQEEERKPSPFPDKNREREVAAKKRAASLGRKRTAGAQSRTDASADRDDATAAEGASTGKACFFSSKPGYAVTASGVDANADELVAAHATYALGSRVRVTNLANGKAVEVKIIDRLPDPRRIISVSEAAARELGFFEAGLANVKVEVVRESVPPDKP
jgi:rare lipoprotein A